MSSKLLSWVWFGIAIIALLLFMYYQSQRDKDTSNLATDTASSTETAMNDSSDVSAVNLTGSVSNATTDSNSPAPTTSTGPKQERNVGYISSIYDASGKTWVGIDFASVYLGTNARVENGSRQVFTIALAPSVKITVNGEMMTLGDFMAKWNESEAMHSTLFRFTLGKDSMVYGITELKLE